MQDEASDAVLATSNITAAAATNVGGGDVTGPDRPARVEAPPGRSDCGGITGGIGPRAQSETSQRRSPKRQKLTAEHTAADGDLQQSASLHTCKTCSASFDSRNTLMKHIASRKHQERKGMPSQGAKDRRRDRRASKCVGLGETRQAGTALATPLRRGRKGGYAHSVPDQRAPESRSGGV